MEFNSSSLSSGDRIGDFVIERVLGKGSFGITYLASDTALDRKVAIKEFFPDNIVRRERNGTIVPHGGDAENVYHWALERFSDEARTLAKFTHPNIVRVLQLIPSLHGTAYIVMEYVEGVTLEEWVEREGLPNRDDTLAIFRQLLDGCGAVHRIGILHRDIKPFNIMLRHKRAGEEGDIAPVLIDFGNSRDLALQQKGFTAVVTDCYSPPEQYSGKSVQNDATDIYALACTMHFLLTGHAPPVSAARHEEELEKVPPARAALFGDRLINGVLRGMELKVVNRPQTIAAWREMLGIDAPAVVEDIKPTGTSRRGLLIGGAGVAVLAAAGGTAWFLRRTDPLSGFQQPLAIGWRKELGTVGPDPFVQIAATANGAVLAAHAMGDDGLPRMRVLRLGEDGTIGAEWRDEAADGEATSILPTADGGAFVGGRVGEKAVLVRLGPNWRPRWRYEAEKGRVTAVLATPAGAIMGIEGVENSGSQIVAVDAGGKLAWRIAIDKGRNETIQRMIALKSGGYAVLGWGVQARDTPQGVLNQNYAWTALLDGEGNSRNRPQTNGLGAATGWAIAEVGNTIFVAGRTSDGRPDSPSRLLLWSIDATGATRWQRWDYPATPSSGRALAASEDGALYVGGWSGAPLHMRLAQIGPEGDLLWDMVEPAKEPQSAIIDLAMRPAGGGFAVATAPVSDGLNRLIVTKIAV